MRRLNIPLLLLLLSACSTMPSHSPVADPEMAWQERQYHLAALDDWTLAGRLAIQSDHEGWHVAINWEQQNQNYSILLTAPLGQGSLKLDGNADSVTLLTDEGETLSASDPGELLYRRFGWRIPVKALRYWVLGVPAPGARRDEQLDEYGRLVQLQQDGWEIHFLDYEPRMGIELPGRVFVNNHQAKVKLVISDWQTLPTP
jgi:outer membrane lipoprotein LolB